MSIPWWNPSLWPICDAIDAILHLVPGSNNRPTFAPHPGTYLSVLKLVIMDPDIAAAAAAAATVLTNIRTTSSLIVLHRLKTLTQEEDESDYPR